MTDTDYITAQLPCVLEDTNFELPATKYQGKVRDCYIIGDTRVLVTSDRLSCFDVVLCSVPFKGQCLNELALDWFQQVEDICPNHLIDAPHPNVMIAREVEILPVEIIVRDYLAGSAWRDYIAGKKISGISLPAGLQQYQKLPETILTPSTKAEKGKHDLPISEEEILSSNLFERKLWEEVKEVAFTLFSRGQEIAASRGLVLVDTKYEFGLRDGKLVLADEIHTVDCSRFWIKDSLHQKNGEKNSPEMLDKEPIRQWLIEQGFQGEGSPPEISDEKRIELARHYIKSFELVSGKKFTPRRGDIHSEIQQVLNEYFRSS